MTNVHPCHRCGRTPADETRPVRRWGKGDPVFFCADCWEAVRSRAITPEEMAKEASAKKVVDEGTTGEGRHDGG